MQIPFIDLKRNYDTVRGEIDKAVTAVMESGFFVMGERVVDLEKKFARFCGVPAVAACASGTDALYLALKAHGIGSGDEVVTVAMTAPATPAAIVMTGATPVFCDIRPDTLTMDAASAASAITPRTKALLPVHIYGQCCDMDALMVLAKKKGLLLIEDCSQAHGAEFGGRRAGSFGQAASFSFYPTKNLSAMGDAGAVVSSADIIGRVQALRNYGRQKTEEILPGGINSRMDDIQAAVLLVKLGHLEQWNEKRRRIAEAYRQGLEGSSVVCPVEAPGRKHIYHIFAVRVPERESFRSRLSQAGVSTLVHYAEPADFKRVARVSAPLAETERACREVLSLPIFPEMTEKEVEGVIAACRKAAKG